MGLMESIRSERVCDLPLRQAITLPPDCPVHSAIERMREEGLGCAVAVDAEGKPLGTFSERTVIELLVQQLEAVDRDTIGDHLDAKWFCVGQEDPLAKVVQAIREQGARFICVTDEQGRVVALTGQKGLAEYIAEHYPQQVIVQRVGGKPGQETREGA